jgi:D-alanyl-D-alanine carboxypeptidase
VRLTLTPSRAVVVAVAAAAMVTAAIIVLADGTHRTLLASSKPTVSRRIGSAATASARASAGPQGFLAALVRAGAPGAVALVQSNGHIQTFAAGLADVSTKTPMQAGLRFRVGSISKTVVATLILKLYSQGRLKLSDTVAHWLPGLLATGQRVTILELLDQRSGLPDYLAAPQLNAQLLAGKTPLGRVWTPSQLLSLIKAEPLTATPGTHFEYSNTNYLLLGSIVERVTHVSLQSYAEHELFAPLKMRATSFALGLVPGAHAHGYEANIGPFRRAPGGLGDTEMLNGSQYAAAASLVSTATDLDRFYTALFSDRIVSRALVGMMQATQPAEGNDYQGYGLGLEGSRYGCGMTWGHGGDVWGYRAVVRASRDARHLVVLLVNEDESPKLVGPIDSTVASLYCGK